MEIKHKYKIKDLRKDLQPQIKEIKSHKPTKKQIRTAKNECNLRKHRQ